MTGYDKNKEEEFLTATAHKAKKEEKTREKMIFILRLFQNFSFGTASFNNFWQRACTNFLYIL
jgi:hypothetical protein